MISKRIFDIKRRNQQKVTTHRMESREGLPSEQQNTNIPVPRKRGRPKGSKNSKKRDSFDTLQFSLNQHYTADAPRKSSRSHATTSMVEYASDDENGDFNPLNPVRKGIYIEDVVAGPPLGQGEAYICKMPSKSYLHLQQLNSSDISATKAQNPYSKYQKCVSRMFEVTFPSIKGFTEPVNKLLDPNVFIAERIVTHQCDEELVHVVEQHIDMSHYLPGLPIDNSTDLQEFLRFQKPLQNIMDADDPFVGPDGAFILEPRLNNEIQEEVNDSQENPESDDTPPPKTKFLIKWRGLPLSQATWETPETLFAGPICPGNYDEIKEMIRQYWHRLRHQDTEKEIKSDDATKIIPPIRGYPLSKQQQTAVKKLLTSHLHAQYLTLVCPEESGRTVIISTFLQTMRFAFHHKKPAMIVCHPLVLPIWKNTLRMMTNLHYATLQASDRDRSLHKQYEVSGDSVSKFDVLIASSFIVEAEAQFVTGLGFETIILDMRKGIPPRILALIEGDHHIIYINDVEIETIPHIKVEPTHFRYTERLIMDENLTKPVLNTFITDLLKNKQSSQSVEPVAADLFHLSLLMMDHVTLSPQMNEIANRIFRSKHSIGKRQFSAQENIEFLAEYSSKFTRLLNLTRENGLQIIVANDYSVLRIIRQFLGYHGIFSVWINSNLIEEQPSLVTVPTTGVALMIRSEYSSILAQMRPTRVIFYNIAPNLKIDVELVHYFMRNDSPPEIVRLLTKDSIETILYSQFLRVQDLDISLLQQLDYEILLRAITLTSKPARQTPEDLPSEISFEIPSEQATIYDKIDRVFDYVKKCSNYWEDIFPSPSGQPLKQCAWAQQEAQQLLEGMFTMKSGNWQQFSSNFNYPLEEIKEIGHAITLHHMTRLLEEDFVNYSVSIAAFQIEYFNKPYEAPVASPKTYWNDIAMRDTTYPASLFVMKGMQKIFANATRLFSVQQRCIFIRAFMYINPEPTIPARCRSIQFDNPEYLYKILNAFLEGATTSPNLMQKIPGFTQQDFDTVFKAIYPQIKCEVLMYVTRMVEEGARDTDITELRPILSSIISGPFYFGWTDQNILDIIRSMSLFGIPVLENTNTPDYPLFMAMSGITGRSLDSINTFMETFYTILIAAHSSKEILIIPESLSLLKPMPVIVKGKEVCQPLTIAFEIIDRTIRSIDMIGFARKTSKEGFDRFCSQPFLPHGWDKECDAALLEGIVQYGLDARGQMAIIPFKKPRVTFYDCMMRRSLSEFKEFMSMDNVGKRLSFLILNSTRIPRRISFWDGGIKHISFRIQPRNEWERDMKALEVEYNHEYLIRHKQDFLVENPQFREYLEEKEKEKKRIKEEKNVEKVKVNPKKKTSKQIYRGLSPPPQKKSYRSNPSSTATENNSETPQKSEKVTEGTSLPSDETQSSENPTPHKPTLKLKLPKQNKKPRILIRTESAQETTEKTEDKTEESPKKRRIILTAKPKKKKLNLTTSNLEVQQQTEQETKQKPKKSIVYVDAQDMPSTDSSDEDSEETKQKNKKSLKKNKKHAKDFLQEMNKRANTNLRERKPIEYNDMDEDEEIKTPPRITLKRRAEKKSQRGEDTPSDQDDGQWKN
ncbi:hypothetical protein TVAG_391600 [Trichomonas vaginalis G3]|uniref:Chromo domain-containing protein n=1 Tax=Trichomonas vaginalis (strain ATCC PRA-98 / G3) TaxID=412133 RepID=A2DFS3_TRIV3|nr:chromodomain-helicase-DNA-binding protein 3-related-related family [Trichomonas vaginalis G3]EAY20776.1 hypothetical protein TVAG_391600 [Trichomonas vaginalis G3]KAI5529438.1 chromodomain-helicase-DNA-binding protein 3-related-related family [Trichomonas vaginalis G3]|eukprot:XP_001581762.1 hypothetical protein [Trichomonas vaginalis G3]